jgi:hypothetical protein
VANYFHNIAYGLSEEATLYKKELERYFKRFSDRYNSIEQIYAGIRYIDKKGHEVAKFWEGRVGGEYNQVKVPFHFSPSTLPSGWEERGTLTVIVSPDGNSLSGKWETESGSWSGPATLKRAGP